MVSALSSAFDTVSIPFDNAMDKVAKIDKRRRASADASRTVKECKALL